MDVLIKSFDRPYYLERCIGSVLRFLKGCGTIIVMDDGTQPVHLARVREKFPGIVVRTSPNAGARAAAVAGCVREARPCPPGELPLTLWRGTVGDCRGPFLLMEDDGWLTGEVDAAEVRETMERQRMVTVKLYWAGNRGIIGKDHTPVSRDIERIAVVNPFPPSILRPLLRNTLKVRSVLSRTGIVTMRHLLPLYGRYTVASAVFDPTYWLYVNATATGRVDEFRQLARAMAWEQRHPGTSFGKTVAEKAMTSYTTSSSNTLSSVAFHMHRLNHALNGAWLAGRLDSFQGFPGDFSEAYLGTFVEFAADQPGFRRSDWETWIRTFRSMYEDIGSVTR